MATTFDFIANELTSVVGAHRDDDFGSDTGAAYVFFKGSQEKLLPDPAVAGEQFGKAVAIHLNLMAVGAPQANQDQGGSLRVHPSAGSGCLESG